MTVYGSLFMMNVFPITSWSDAKRRFQYPLVSTATGYRACPAPSAAVKSRPRTVCAPSIERKFVVTRRPVTCSGSPPPVIVPVPTSSRPISSKDWLCSRQSRKFGADGPSRWIPSLRSVSQTIAVRSEPGKGNERSSTELTTLKIAVLAPMPSPRTSSATSVKPGILRKVRKV